MLQKVFIPSDSEDLFSAKLAKHAVERRLSPGSSVKVEIIPNTPTFQGVSLARFTAPERMAYTGQALVITPYMFAVQDVTPLLTLDLESNRAAATKEKSSWSTDLLLLDASKLKDWKIKDFIRALEEEQVHIEQITDLSIEPDVLELPMIWNSVEQLTTETKVLHLTNPATFPWRTGLLEASNTQSHKLFGIELGGFGKFFSNKPKVAPKHPDKKIEAFIIDLAISAYKSGVLDDTFIKSEIAAKRIRPDITTLLKQR